MGSKKKKHEMEWACLEGANDTPAVTEAEASSLVDVAVTETLHLELLPAHTTKHQFPPFWPLDTDPEVSLARTPA